MRKASFALGLLAAAAAQAQSLDSVRANEPVFRSGNWFVVRSVRDGGNVVACTGFYRANPRVQVSKDGLILKVPVELQTVALGFGSQPPRPARPPQKLERDMRAVVVAGNDFEELKRSNKLTLDLVTAQGKSSHSLDLNGMNEALANINAGCPVPESRVQAGGGGMRAPACGPRIMQRMRAAKVTEEQIRSICE